MSFPGMLAGDTLVIAPSGSPADGKAIVATGGVTNGAVATEWRSLSVDLSGYQPLDADLTALAALGYTSGSFLIKKTAANTYSLIALTAAGEALLDDADAAAQRTTMGAIGGSLGSTDNRILRADGTGGATAQGSAVTIDDSGNVSGVAGLTIGGRFTLPLGELVKWAAGSGLVCDTDGRFSFANNGGSSLIVFNSSASSSSLGTSNYLHVPNLQADGNLTASGNVKIGSDCEFVRTGTTTLQLQNGSGSAVNTLVSSLFGGEAYEIRGSNYYRWEASGSSARLRNTSSGNVVMTAASSDGVTFTSTVTVGPSTFAALPSASANTGAILRVTDRAQKLAYSDGTNWLWVHDNAVAS